MGKFSLPKFKKKDAAEQEAAATAPAAPDKDIADLLQDDAENTNENKSNTINIIRSILVALAFLMILAVVIFQWSEIDTYKIKDDMFERIGKLFQTTEVASNNVPANNPAEVSEDAPATTDSTDSEAENANTGKAKQGDAAEEEKEEEAAE